MRPTVQPSKRGRVLAVDDSPVMRVLVASSLEAAGYSVEAVDSGHAALDAIEAGGEEPFDAVILDVDMPGMDGLAVGRALRRDPRFASTPVAMHTSLEEAQVRSGFDQYDAFLPKPCEAGQLAECIERMIREHRRRQGRDD